MALHLHRCGNAVTLVPRRVEHATVLATTRENEDYLPGVALPADIQIAHEPRPPLMEADVIMLACPSCGLRPLVEKIVGKLDSAWRSPTFISLVKGLEQHTLLRPSQVLGERLPGRAYGVLSGPTNAREIARSLPSAAVLATTLDGDAARQLQAVMSSHVFRIYLSEDVVGVELGGILKNVYAIGAGICDGMGFGDNAKASYLTRALQEMMRIGNAAGGRPETFLGLSGLGDLDATAHGEWSRNRAFGEALTRQGETVQGYLGASSNAVEGYRAAACLMELVRARGVSTPILAEIYGVLYSGNTPAQSIASLMSRMLTTE
jgi:glycerol-3-phosphate dehydrogenase (NAD(P)+)